MKKSCIETNKNRLVVFQENRSKLTIDNEDQVSGTKVIVDGCQITNGIRCDFMYLAKNVEFFIELKGQDLKHALDQISATIKSLSSDPKRQKKISIIICTRSPMTSASIQNLRVKFRKNHNSDLIIKSTPFLHKI